MIAEHRRILMLNKVLYLNQITLFHNGYTLIAYINCLQECGGEEKKEVSTTLRKLRTKFDNVNKLVKEKERELEELKVSYSSLIKIEKT